MANLPGEKSFRRRFIELATGVGMAQAVSLLFMPFISRTFDPADMGLFAIYLAVSTIIGAVSCLRLDVAVVLAKDDDEAVRLIWLSSALSAAISLAVTILLLALRWFWKSDWTLAFCLLTGFSVFLIGGAQSFLYWNNRHRRYTVISTKNVSEKLVSMGLSLALGLLGFTALGLILGQTVGFMVALLYLTWHSGVPLPRFSSEVWRQTFRDYSDFPRRNVLGSLFNTFAIFGPPILFAGYFGKADVGQFSLASRVFELPINLIGNTFHAIYYQHVTQKSLEERRHLFHRTLRLVVMVGAIPLAAVAYWGGPLFALIFGQEWLIAGQLAIWLAPLTLIRLMFLSQAPLLLVGRRLHRDMWISALQFASQAAGFFIGYYAWGSFTACVAGMCICGGIMYAVGVIAIQRTLAPSK